MINLSDDNLIVQQATRELRKRGEPRKRKLTIEEFCRMMLKQSQFIDKHNIRHQGFSMLLYISEHWIEKHEGINIYKIGKTMKGSYHASWGTLTSLQERAKVLLKHGLIDEIGKTPLGAPLYAPTRVTLVELSDMLNVES